MARRGMLIMTLAVGLMAPSSASAFGFGLRGTTTSYYAPVVTYRAYYYYEPIPVYYAAPACVPTAPPPLVAQPIPAPTPNRPFAPPMPAPASPAPPYMPKTSEPPLSHPAPRISESRSEYHSFAVAPRVSETPSLDRCSVTFWNLTPRSVNLNVEGRNYTVASGRSLKVEPAREFVWHVDTREAQTERVPSGEGAVDIVIRR